MVEPNDRPFTIAAVQATPVFMDRKATIEKACDIVAEASRAGAKLVVFPEAFVPAYPFWVGYVPAAKTDPLRTLYAELLTNAVTVPSDATEELCAAARRARVTVVIGINERDAEASRSTLYNTMLYIDDAGRILGKHRKLVPTAGERLVHGQGDGSTLDVYDLPIGRIGGLICWENYMPLARYALYAWGVQLYLAPTWDGGEPWLSTLRHIGKEGRVYVVGCCTVMRHDDIPDRFGFLHEYVGDQDEWINPGDSAIVDPDGRFVAGPTRHEETILYADVDPKNVSGPRWQLDVAGHDGRPDVFHLTVHREPRPMIAVAPPATDAPEGRRVVVEETSRDAAPHAAEIAGVGQDPERASPTTALRGTSPRDRGDGPPRWGARRP